MAVHLRKNHTCCSFTIGKVNHGTETVGPFHTRENKLRATHKPRTAHIKGTKCSFVAYVSRERAFCTRCCRMNGSVRGSHRLIFPRINGPSVDFFQGYCAALCLTFRKDWIKCSHGSGYFMCVHTTKVMCLIPIQAAHFSKATLASASSGCEIAKEIPYAQSNHCPYVLHSYWTIPYPHGKDRRRRKGAAKHYTAADIDNSV